MNISDFIITVGGFGAHPGHDPHILNTISAVQIIAIVDALDEIDGDKIARCEFPPLASSMSLDT